MSILAPVSQRKLYHCSYSYHIFVNSYHSGFFIYTHSFPVHWHCLPPPPPNHHSYIPFCGRHQIRRAIASEIRVTLFEKEDKLLDHPPDVVWIYQCKTQFHCSPDQKQKREQLYYFHGTVLSYIHNKSQNLIFIVALFLGFISFIIRPHQKSSGIFLPYVRKVLAVSLVISWESRHTACPSVRPSSVNSSFSETAAWI